MSLYNHDSFDFNSSSPMPVIGDPRASASGKVITIYMLTNGNDVWDTNLSNIAVHAGRGEDDLSTGGKHVVLDGGDGNDDLTGWGNATDVILDGGASKAPKFDFGAWYASGHVDMYNMEEAVVGYGSATVHLEAAGTEVIFDGGKLLAKHDTALAAYNDSFVFGSNGAGGKAEVEYHAGEQVTVFAVDEQMVSAHELIYTDPYAHIYDVKFDGLQDKHADTDGTFNIVHVSPVPPDGIG